MRKEILVRHPEFAVIVKDKSDLLSFVFRDEPPLGRSVGKHKSVLNVTL